MIGNQSSRGQENDVFSQWHRKNLPSHFTATKLDLNEYCPKCHQALVLVEEMAINTPPNEDAIKAHLWLARAAQVPLILVKTDRVGDDEIRGFLIRPLYLVDKPLPDNDYVLGPNGYYTFVWNKFRLPHQHYAYGTCPMRDNPIDAAQS